MKFYVGYKNDRGFFDDKQITIENIEDLIKEINIIDLKNLSILRHVPEIK